MTNSTTSDKENKRKLKWWAILFWLVIWQIASVIIGQEILLVSPLSAIKRVGTLVIEAEFWRSIGFSVGRILLGFFTAFFLGIFLGILSANGKRIEELLYPIMQAIKSVPVASFIILCLVWISSKNLSVFISFLMVLPIIYTNTLDGIRNVDRGILEMAHVFKIPFFKKIFYIYGSYVIPYIKTASSISLGMCWKAGIAAEVIGIPDGSIGEKLYLSKLYLNMEDLFAWTLMIVIISVLFEKLILGFIKLLQYEMERL
ncbi:MAG TPA: ABC transporter permease subunit [Candidatus Merdenecus merdavium]|nr:ABC transporter permease subunit [Candidatus Merdenecus merdavium]